MTYASPTEIRIPPKFDPELVTKTLDELVAWRGPWPKFADEDTVIVAIKHAKTAKQLDRIREFTRDDGKLVVAYLRNIPKKHWKAATTEHVPETATIALIRGIRDTRASELRVSDALVHLTDAEFDTLVAALLKAPEVRLVSNTMAARIVALLDASQTATLFAKLTTYGSWRLLRAITDEVVVHLLGTTERRDLIAFEALRRGLLDGKQLETELARVATAGPFDRRLFQLPSYGEYSDCTEAEVLAAHVEAHRHAQPLRERLHAWFAEQLPALRVDDLHDSGLAFVFVLAFDDAACARFAELCNANKERFDKSHHVAWIVRALSDALVPRADADQLLAALGKRLEGKTLADLVAQTAARLAKHRTALGGPANIDWGRTDCNEVEALLGKLADPKAVAMLIDAGVRSDDPVAVLNAFVTAYRHAVRYRNNVKPDPKVGRALCTWQFMETALRALERLYTPDAPDGDALVKRIGEFGHSAGYRVKPAIEGLYWLGADDDADRERFTKDVLLPLYAQTKNVKFKSWIEDIVVQVSPELEESTRDRLVRLARETAGDDTVTRSFVFRTDTAPGKQTINRLYGKPIGVDAKRWPKFGKKPMAHLITLETRLFAPAIAKSYADAGVVAVAVFVSSLDHHKAFEPGTKHVELVHLTAKQVARGVASADGIGLDVVTCELPAAVFKGGVKQGALWELRRTLDHTDFLTPDRGSPTWIQEPEYFGEFLFEADELLDRLNLGDNGRFYVFADTAFMQCH